MRTVLARRAQRRVPLRKARALLLLLAMTLVGQAAPAEAHQVYWRGDMGSTGNFCLQGTAEIGHVTDYEISDSKGFAITKVETREANPSWAPCWQRLPTYVEHAAAGFTYYWDFQYGGSWQPCFGSDWSLRYGATSSVRNWVVNDPSYGCGSTYYMFYAGIGARANDNDPWIADWKLAGTCCGRSSWYHWFNAL